MWAFVVVPFPNASVIGAPVIASVERSVVTFVPFEYEEKASVGALIRKFCSVAIAPLAWVFVLFRLNCTSGALVEAVRPVSAPPVKVRRGVTPEVRAASVHVAVPVAVKVENVRPPEKSAFP